MPLPRFFAPRQCSRSLLVLALLAALVLAGCPGSDGPAPGNGDAADSGPTTAVVSYAADIQTVNEYIGSSVPIHAMLYYYALFVPLAEERASYREGPPTFVPMLAESWEIAEDGLTITFTLREGLLWSDGVPITADDVHFSWQAQTHEQVAWVYGFIKQNIRDVEVIDPRTVRFHYTEATPTALYEAVQGVIIPKHAWGGLPFEEWRDNAQFFADNLVVSGPFDLESHEPGQRIVLARNDNYFDEGKPIVDRVVYEIVPDTTNQLALLRSGRAHFIELVPYADAAALDADPDIYLTSYTPKNYYYVGWNVQREPFDSAEVRRALTHAIDRQAIIDNLFYGYGKISHSPLASDVWAYNDGISPLEYDPAKASEMLADAGFADTDGDGILDRGGEPFSLELLTNSENQLRQDIVIMIQSQLKRIGIEVVPKVMEFNAMMGPLGSHDFDAMVMGLGVGTDLDLTTNFHSKGIDGGYNWGGLSDPEVDRLIEAANTPADLAERKAHFDRLQERLHELQAVTFLYEGERVGAAREELQEIHPNALSSFANMRTWQLTTDGTD